MSEVFISYARETETYAKRVADALRSAGFGVWYDDDLPAHRAFSEVIEERLREAKAVIVIWSAGGVKSEWVRAEADFARKTRTLIQLVVDKTELPLPFSQIQCTDLAGWSGNAEAPGWRKIIASVEELVTHADGSKTTQSEPAPAAMTGEHEYPALPDKPSIAALAFADMTGAAGQDYFCDGMVMEIVRALSRFPSLFVIAAESGLTYRGSQRSHKDIARELGVRYLLVGSVRKSADKVRVAVQLIDAASGNSIWTERFDGTMEDVFALQDTVASAVAGQIAPRIEAAEVRRAVDRPTDDLGAYDLYLRATHKHYEHVGREGLSVALPLYERAIERDPRFGLALAGAGYCHALLFRWGWSETPVETQTRARELIRRALDCDGDNPDVLSLCGHGLYNVGGDLPTAEAMLERSLVLNPGSWEAWYNNGILKTYAGKGEVAFESLQTALHLNPRCLVRPVILGMMGWSHLYAQHFDEAIPLLKQAGELLPSFEGPAVALVACLAHLNRISEAKTVLAGVRPEIVTAMLGWFIDPEKVLRSGLARAGVNV